MSGTCKPETHTDLGDLADFAVIVLAAGRSQRMGARNKLLEPVAGKPLLAHALETIGTLAPGELIVVTGHERGPVENLASGYAARLVHNASYREGMGTSLACGAGAVNDRAKGVFIHLGDVPFVSASTYQALASALAAERNRAIEVFVPVHGGARGHPVLFRREVLPRLCELRGDEGARRVIGEHRCLEVNVSDPNIARDIDTAADLVAVTSRS